jgi:methylenetetrahydrofolate--tRNA-(uracil-5-)-methyltransferase
VKDRLIIVGGGLAGSEAAWQAAQIGVPVSLFEMRPYVNTGAHTSPDLAELVCSNSLGSNKPDRAAGLLKQELRSLGSLLIQCADRTAVPAGGALAVDRGQFAATVTDAVVAHPLINTIREEVLEIPTGPTIIASGPLTSKSLSESIIALSGKDNLYFFDAIAPIVSLESVDLNIAFRGSRYGHGTQEEGDYINCPMDEVEYNQFVSALLQAERIELKEFDLRLEKGVDAGAHKYFEGCLPIEILARRGRRALAFGPLRPVGLTDPRTGHRPFAVVQLRQDNIAGSIYNLVGFQTNLKFSEQRRVFRMIPGLKDAEFVRCGQMHRNMFIHSPELIEPNMQCKSRSDLFFAGQITGVEGYAGNIASGWLAGMNAGRMTKGDPLLTFPIPTMIGALMNYVTHAAEVDFQPMKANYGILPELSQGKKMNKKQRAAAYSDRALDNLKEYMTRENIEAQRSPQFIR